MRLVLVFCFLLLCAIHSDGDKRVNKYVTTLIDAKWKETPLILEAAEYLNDENPSYFWKFVDTFANRDLENGNFQMTRNIRLRIALRFLVYSFLPYSHRERQL